VKRILYREVLVKVLAKKHGQAYACWWSRPHVAKCGKCRRGVLIADDPKCKVCGAEIEWLYDAVSGLVEYQRQIVARYRRGTE
jgi:hypothetical protein